MKPPDPGWLPFMKMIFGFVVVSFVFSLGMCIALGKVEEHSSFGLPFILGSLSNISGGFAQWAFGAVAGAGAAAAINKLGGGGSGGDDVQ